MSGGCPFFCLFDVLCHRIRSPLSLKIQELLDFQFEVLTKSCKKRLNVRKNLESLLDQPCKGGKSQTAQGEAQRNPGIRH